MTKIDWDKPLRSKGDKQTLLYVGPHPDGSGAQVCVWPDSTIGYVLPHAVENVPQEPEREEGEMWLGSTLNREDVIATWHTDTWWEDGDTCHSFQPIERLYRRKEYRPADKCPPPMDGTPFEVEGHTAHFRGVWSDEDEAIEWIVCGEGHYRSFAWIRDTRWRPLQDSQP